MTAQIGADGLDVFGDPRPELLIDVTRVQPEPGGEWVNLERLGFHSTQRLRISDLAGGVVVATWPAELARQARYLYGHGLGSSLVAAAIDRGWTVEPSPHIAYWRASPGRRLYMRPPVTPLDYVACWEDTDALSRVGNHAREDVEHDLWRWLKQRGFADNGDDTVLHRFLDEFLGNRPAQMRPGLRFRRVWTPVEVAELAPRSLRPSAATSVPCSLLRVSRSCITQILAQARRNRQAPVTGLVRKPRPVQRRSGAGRRGPRGLAVRTPGRPALDRTRTPNRTGRSARCRPRDTRLCGCARESAG